MMTSAQVVETSVNVTSNSPSQDYTHPDDHNLPNYNLDLFSRFSGLKLNEEKTEFFAQGSKIYLNRFPMNLNTQLRF